MSEKNNLPQIFIEHTPWESGSNSIWPATSFTLHRNLARYLFPTKLSPVHFQHVLSHLSENLLKLSQLDKPQLLKADTINAFDKEFLYEHFLCTDGFQNTLAGQGFVIDHTGHFLATINLEDHLQMRLLDCQEFGEKTWEKLNQIETALTSSLELAYSPRFGYLTSDPKLCGTALVVQAFLHLPALIHMQQLHETLQKHQEDGIIATGMGGNLEDLIGDLVILHNGYTLGINEENILHDIRSMAMKLMALEKTLRSRLKTEESLEMKDQVSRAYGLMLHSYQLQTKETLSALSLLKLGLDLDWITGITDSMLNTLFFKCRRAHLGEAVGKQLSDAQEVARNRAEFIHKQIQCIQLKI